MSTQQSSGSAGYRRDDYFAGAPGDDYTTVDDAQGHPDHRPSGTNKHRWVAKSVLANGATYLDPIVLNNEPTEYDLYDEEDVGTAMVLSAPRHHIVADETREGPSAYSHQKRVNEALGHLLGGGTIQDRDLKGFLDCIDGWLRFLYYSRQPSQRLTTEEIEYLREEAEWMKRHSDEDEHDTDIVAQLSEAVDLRDKADGFELADYFEGT